MATNEERRAKVRNTKTANICSIHEGKIYFDYDNGGRAQAALGSDEAYTLFEDGTSIPSFRVVTLGASYYTESFVTYTDTKPLVDFVDVQMTVRAERRGNKIHWYAYRRAFGKLNKKYVGCSEQLTERRLLEIARALPTTR